MQWIIRLAAAGVLVASVAACGSSGEGGREVNITQRDDGCTPTRIDATPGEKLKLVVKNESDDDYEVEGIEGTKLEEVVVPSGRTRSPGYTVPGDESGTYKIKCYVPAGTSTIIEVVAGGGGASSGDATAEPDPEPDPVAEEGEDEGEADATVGVSLVEYSITANPASVSAGKIRFDAMNESASQVHELAVLKPKGDGDFDNLGEIEDIAPGGDGTVTLDLEAGEYVLACLIVAGEAGSTVDHFDQGMKVDFVVE
jgi:uncharacterized cupredoxin-like copper-binding protein